MYDDNHIVSIHKAANGHTVKIAKTPKEKQAAIEKAKKEAGGSAKNPAPMVSAPGDDHHMMVAKSHADVMKHVAAALKMHSAETPEDEYAEAFKEAAANMKGEK